jgi:hypothetical protein
LTCRDKDRACFGSSPCFLVKSKAAFFLKAVSYAYKRETLSRRMGRHFSSLFKNKKIFKKKKKIRKRE